MEKAPIESAPGLKEGISKAQSEHYKDVIMRLMERSGDNSELINSMNDFLGALDVCSWRGSSDQPMSEGYANRLAEFFRQKTEELKNMV